MTIDEIYSEIIAALQSGGVAVSDSVTSRRGITANVVATAFYTQRKLQELFRREMDLLEAEREPYREEWYARLALNFQLGFPVNVGFDTFDNTGYTQQEIAASKVVKHVQVVELRLTTGRVILRILVAGDTGIDPAQLDQSTVDALQAYFEKAKILGTRLEVASLPADLIKLEYDIYYDPQILNNLGARLDGTDNEPVQTAIKGYLKSLPFYKGKFNVAECTDTLQAVPGVAIPHIKGCQCRAYNGAFAVVSTEYQTTAGWLRFGNIATDLILNFIPHA